MSRLRLQLARRGLARRLLAELNRQLEARRLALKRGALLDASLVEAPVRRAELHPAHVNESVVADGLIVGDERAVYADRAYEHQARRRRLRAAGVKDRIKHRRRKHLARPPRWQRRRNQLIERRRSAVERVFATLKQRYGYRRVRYRGLARNALELLFKCMADNLRRADALLA